MMRVEVYGDVLDLSDEIIAEERPKYLAKMRAASRLLRDRVTQILSANAAGPSAPGEAPAMDEGELARSIKTIGTRVIADKLGGPATVRGGIELGDEDDIEKIQSLEYGATGPNGRVLQPRPFMRPAEAQVEAEIERLARE